MKTNQALCRKAIQLSEKISELWSEEKYLDICRMGEEVYASMEALSADWGEGAAFLINKAGAYYIASVMAMGYEEGIESVIACREHEMIRRIYADAEIGKWLVEALNQLNLDAMRCAYLRRMVPEEYQGQFDLKKYDLAEAEKQESNMETFEMDPSYMAEWETFLTRCDAVGVMDLQQYVLDFPKEYFQGETRDGFYIEPLMKNAWAANLEILHKVDILCQTLEIPYFVNWGTMLGTVRHKGMIPWDDDIDIGVLRKDYDKLKYAINHCQNELVFSDAYDTEEWGFHASKISNELVFKTNRNAIKRYHGFSFFASIDVFVVDCVPRDKALEKEQYDVLQIIANVVHILDDMENMDAQSDEYYYIRQNVKCMVDTIQRMCHVEFQQEIPTRQELLILTHEVLSLYMERDSDYYTVPHRLSHGQDYYIPKEVFGSMIRMPFENIEVNVPVGYDFILTKNYGENYMTPIQRKAGHDYPFYGSLMDAMVEKRKGSTREETMEYIKRVSYGYYDKFLHQTNEQRIRFSEDYFREETIDGVLLTEEMKRNRAAELEILEEIKHICKEKGITYYAIGDTVAGAGTKKGYLPHAEGIHLGMKRDDYAIFMNCLGEELDSWFDYESIYLDDEHLDMRSFITTDAFLVKDEDYLERFHGCQEIVGIDISPLDAVAEDEAQEASRQELFATLLRVADVMPAKPPYSEDVLSLVEEWESRMQIPINRERGLKREFLRIADAVMADNRELTKFRVTPDLQVGLSTIYDSADFAEAEEVPFENTTIAVPVGWRRMMS